MVLDVGIYVKIKHQSFENAECHGGLLQAKVSKGTLPYYYLDTDLEVSSHYPTYDESNLLPISVNVNNLSLSL